MWHEVKQPDLDLMVRPKTCKEVEAVVSRIQNKLVSPQSNIHTLREKNPEWHCCLSVHHFMCIHELCSLVRARHVCVLLAGVNCSKAAGTIKCVTPNENL